MVNENQIFKATYSGIPVYEMMCKGVAVMRRRADSWLNATQILKVAGFDKPQRTRILEREVQKGEHEKVQGGYGKYQGTWIPLERGVQLCQQYNCENLLRPIVDFTPDDKSPPLAPKHLVAAPHITTKPLTRAPATSSMNTRSSRRAAQHLGDESDDDVSMRRGTDGSLSPTPSEVSSSSRTPSPIRDSPDPTVSTSFADDDFRSPAPSVVSSTVGGASRKRKHRSDGRDRTSGGANGHYIPRDPDTYKDQILEYFISDTNQIPPLLINPPMDFNPNLEIDDDGHTALHWASAMGRVRVVKLLLTAGADIFKVNKTGQTPLMRSVMFANNYDVRKFPELYELLHRSTLNIDNNNRTVFHHIVDVAMSKGKTHAARYYMETVLDRLSEYPKELADVVNFKDEDHETALTLAARCRSKRLVKLLIDHGADPKIRNRDGKSAEDYILEDERFRASPLLPNREASTSRGAQSALGSPNAIAYGYTSAADRPPLRYSTAAQRASTECVSQAANLLDGLATAYDAEFRDKDRDLNQAVGLSQTIQDEILDSQRCVAVLKAQAQPLPQGRGRLDRLEAELRDKMGARYRFGWEKWVKEEEEREKILRDACGGELVTFSAASGVPRASNGENISDLLALHADVPTDAEQLKDACAKLRAEVEGQRKTRRKLFDDLVLAQREANTGGRMAQYRRLIGAGCGGLPPQDVDHMVQMLLQTLESEEPSSSTPWNNTTRQPMVI